MSEPKIRADQFWHLVDTTYPNLLHHSAKLGKGIIYSISYTANINPELEEIGTPYSIFNLNDPKENIFESIRKNEFSELPSRSKAFFVFDDYKLAEKALGKWFSNNNREIEECLLFSNCKIHRADTEWLNCEENQWEEYARKYWGSKMSESPFPEILVEGPIYFPKWEKFNLIRQ